MRYVFSLTGDALKNKLDEQAMRYLYSHTGDGLNLKLFIKMTVRRTGYAIPPFTHRRRKEAIDGLNLKLFIKIDSSKNGLCYTSIHTQATEGSDRCVSHTGETKNDRIPARPSY